MRSRYPARRSLAVVAVLALLVTACGDDAPEDAGGPVGKPTLDGRVNERNTLADTSRRAGIAMALEDFAFDPTYIIGTPRATVVVNLDNSTDNRHSFTIDEPRMDVVLEPRSTGRASLTLPSGGVVNFYCKFHRDRGMQGAFYFAS